MKIPSSSTGASLLDPQRSRSVAGCGKPDRKSALPFALLAVLEDVFECSDKIESPLDSRIAESQFDNAFERLVIREDANIGGPEVASKAFDGPTNAASFQVERSPAPL